MFRFLLVFMFFSLTITVSAQDGFDGLFGQSGATTDSICEGFEDVLSMFSLLSDAFNQDTSENVAEVPEIYFLSYSAQACLLERDYDTALAYYERLREISNERGSTAGSALVINNMGAIYLSRFEYSRALELFTQAQALLESADERLLQGNVLTNIGLVYTYQGQYSRALDFYERGRDILLSSDDTNALIINYANTGFAYFGIANRDNDLTIVETALEFTNMALALLESNQSQSGLFGSTGEGDDTLSFLFEVLSGMQSSETGQSQLVLEMLRGGNPYLRSVLLMNKMNMLYTLQQYEAAQTVGNELLSLVQGLGDDLLYGTVLAQVASIDAELGDTENAISRLNEALVLIEDQRNDAALAFIYSNRGVVYELLGQRDNAISDYVSATEYIESALTDIVIDVALSNTLISTSYTPPYQRLGLLLGETGQVDEAFLYTERSRAIVTRTQLLSGVVDISQSSHLEQDLLTTEDDLRLEIREAQLTLDSVYAAQIMGTTANVDAITAQQQLDTAQDNYAQHLELMQAQGNFYSRELALDVADIQSIQSTLPEDTTLLVYQLNQYKPNSEGMLQQGSFVYIVTRDSVDFQLLDDVYDHDIEELVQAFYASNQGDLNPLSDLYNLVFSPIESQLDTTRLIISSNGQLNYVPFAALRRPNETFLVDDYAISMIPSGTTLHLLANRRPTSSEIDILTLAQPNAPVSTGLLPLQSAISESRNIAAMGNSEILENATETELYQSAGISEVLHISAHAELQPFSPMFSAIYLGSDDENDGLLEVNEIYQMDLSATELVILSGCETGAGGNGEDFALLNRAFMATGARGVISSLWTVDDAATSDLLTTFMQQRTSTSNDAEALQQAMLLTRTNHPDPRNWASFVFTGLPES